jgi:hypothetical protein
MNKGRVGEDRGSKETDRCPLTPTINTTAMATPTIMPAQGHSSTPKFTPYVPRELHQYFQELEILFNSAQVINDAEKKKHTYHYVDIITVDLWESIPEYSVAISFNKFKSTIFKLYPGS